MERLRQSGVPEADLDAWYLLEYVTGISRSSYYMEPDRKMSVWQRARYEECLSRRGAADPAPAYHRGTGVYGADLPGG